MPHSVQADSEVAFAVMQEATERLVELKPVLTRVLKSLLKSLLKRVLKRVLKMLKTPRTRCSKGLLAQHLPLRGR